MSSRILILIPVYNDWEAVLMLLRRLDQEFVKGNIAADVLVIDDASTATLPGCHSVFPTITAIGTIDVLELKRNLGHQRAIAVGLTYIEANLPCRAGLVMDGDGEDHPEDVSRLIQACHAEEYRRIIFAKRGRRSEGLLFRFFYFAYRVVYTLLTGRTIRVGNFSIVPFDLLRRLVVVSEVWNHYAVGIVKAKLPHTEVTAARSKRLSGESKMNFVSLVMHGLSAVSVYGDVAGIRLLIVTLAMIAVAVGVIAVAVIIKLTTTLAIPGWTTYVVALFLVIIMQAVAISLFFVFTILNGRDKHQLHPATGLSLLHPGCVESVPEIMTDYTYIGSELDVFSRATNWKSYYGGLLRKYLGDEVLEVGAGIGATAKLLCGAHHRRWVCLEPDQRLAAEINPLIENRQLPACCEVRLGVVADLKSEETFDSIIYVDVLEHIEDDGAELQRATRHLKPGGNLIVLAPAHQWLYTAFDVAIGHHRRYNRETLARVAPPDLSCVRLFYLDSVGTFASLCNRLLLRSATPTASQIALWDKTMVPFSVVIDPLLRNTIGKSVVGVWQKS